MTRRRRKTQRHGRGRRARREGDAAGAAALTARRPRNAGDAVPYQCRDAGSAALTGELQCFLAGWSDRGWALSAIFAAGRAGPMGLSIELNLHSGR